MVSSLLPCGLFLHSPFPIPHSPFPVPYAFASPVLAFCALKGRKGLFPEIVRREAGKRGYEPERIGALGFSAGAHLTILLATSSETSAYPRVDEADDIPCHVNFAVPIFPAYVLSDGLEGPNRTKGDASAHLRRPWARLLERQRSSHGPGRVDRPNWRLSEEQADFSQDWAGWRPLA